MIAPDYPASGQPISAHWARQLVDYIRAITPQSSPGFRISTMPGGTTFALTNKNPNQLAVDSFPWDKCQFMPLSNGAGVTVNAGSVIKLQRTPYAVAAANVEISESDTYVGIQVARDFSSVSIIALSSEPVTDDDYVRFWFAVFKKIDGSAVLQKLNLGQIMNVDISAYGD